MSASLVGSEMCIRDRQGAARAGQAAATRPAARVEGQPAAQPEAPEGQVPVSYTHLTLPTICSV
eukprot:1986492-Alexandrium_andersonii.AAC.1